jgi:hypothetical protein
MNLKLEKFAKFSFNRKLTIGTIFHVVNKRENSNKNQENKHTHNFKHHISPQQKIAKGNPLRTKNKSSHKESPPIYKYMGGGTSGTNYVLC